MILDIFQQGMARGDFAIREPELAVWMLLGGLRGVIRFGPKPRPADVAERVVQTFLRGADVSPARFLSDALADASG